MNLKNRAIFLSALGFSIGLLIGAVMYVIFASPEDLLNRGALMAQLIGSGIYGAIAMGGSAVYDIESWSLLRATLTHYIMTFGSFFVVNFLLRWFGGLGTLIAFLAFSGAYFVIWIIQYTLWRREIRKINEDLSEMITNDKINQSRM